MERALGTWKTGVYIPLNSKDDRFSDRKWGDTTAAYLASIDRISTRNWLRIISGSLLHLNNKIAHSDPSPSSVNTECDKRGLLVDPDTETEDEGMLDDLSSDIMEVDDAHPPAYTDEEVQGFVDGLIVSDIEYLNGDSDDMI